MKFLGTYRHKFIAGVICLLVLVVLSWIFAFRKTISLLQVNRQLSHNISIAKTTSHDIDELKALVGHYRNIEQISSDALLDSLTLFASTHSLYITNYESVQNIEINDIELHYQPIEVQGTYESIMQLIYYIEHTSKLRSVNHLKFFIHENRKTKQRALRAKLYLLDTTF